MLGFFLDFPLSLLLLPSLPVFDPSTIDDWSWGLLIRESLISPTILLIWTRGALLLHVLRVSLTCLFPRESKPWSLSVLLSILVWSEDLEFSFFELVIWTEEIFNFGLWTIECKLSVFEMPDDRLSVDFFCLSLAGFLRLVILKLLAGVATGPILDNDLSFRFDLGLWWSCFIDSSLLFIFVVLLDWGNPVSSLFEACLVFEDFKNRRGSWKSEFLESLWFDFDFLDFFDELNPLELFGFFRCLLRLKTRLFLVAFWNIISRPLVGIDLRGGSPLLEALMLVMRPSSKLNKAEFGLLINEIYLR